MYEVSVEPMPVLLVSSDLMKLFAKTNDADSWMTHAKALSQLTEIRGCDRYVDEFDFTLLKASRGLIVMYSLFSGRPCYLASKEWHFVMKGHVNTGLEFGFDRLVEDFFAYFTFAPSLIHEFYSFKEADPTDPATQQKISNIVTRALILLDKVSAWYECFARTVPLPYEVLSSTGDTVFPVVLEYSDVNSGTIFCSYYSYTMLLHEILKTCGHPGNHAAMIVYFRDLICMSVEYNTRGILGPYRMGFSLRAVYETADPITMEWLKGWLERLSKVYAVVHPQNYR
ncbi:hypothetical protein EYZ11_013343 [Aspergillus tanneri]|uniref:Uncharacterized protein n=1 Tax=Aspergillus tanneri TaxID=1220188 RepID=A0A4S3IXW1_9EURO|nr:hypothetical protein EYZ11_013343 [Aspergillus tanneri]